jgi:hypothetical protein
MSSVPPKLTWCCDLFLTPLSDPTRPVFVINPVSARHSRTNSYASTCGAERSDDHSRTNSYASSCGAVRSDDRSRTNSYTSTCGVEIGRSAIGTVAFHEGTNVSRPHRGASSSRREWRVQAQCLAIAIVRVRALSDPRWPVPVCRCASESHRCVLSLGLRVRLLIVARCIDVAVDQ